MRIGELRRDQTQEVYVRSTISKEDKVLNLVFLVLIQIKLLLPLEGLGNTIYWAVQRSETLIS